MKSRIGTAARAARWAAAGWLALAGAGSALEAFQTNYYHVAADQALDAERWVAAQRIDIEGRAADDLYLLASGESFLDARGTNGTIRLAGECLNDVWALANRIELTGTIGDHARLMARTIQVDGTVTRSAILVGTSVHLAPGSRLESDAWLMGETLIAAGHVQGALRMTAQNVTLSGTVTGDVTVQAQDLVLMPGTHIGGKLYYRAPAELVLSKQVTVDGGVERLAGTGKPLRGSSSPGASFWVQAWLFLGALLVGAVFFRLFPRLGRRAVRNLLGSFWKCMLVGFVVLALSPIICLAAAVSLVGLPFALMLACGLGMLVYLSKLAVAIYLGQMLVRGRLGSGVWAPLLLGLALLYVGVHAGLAGVVVWLVMASAGTGALLLGVFEASADTAVWAGPPPAAGMPGGNAAPPDERREG